MNSYLSFLKHFFNSKFEVSEIQKEAITNILMKMTVYKENI